MKRGAQAVGMQSNRFKILFNIEDAEDTEF